MKKFCISLSIFILLIALASCGNSRIYISLRKNINNGTTEFRWIVVNKSNVDIRFKDGNITNYELRNRRTGVTISGKSNIDTIKLSPKEKHDEIVTFSNLPKGKYVATFWAVTEDGTKGSMQISFEIK